MQSSFKGLLWVVTWDMSMDNYLQRPTQLVKLRMAKYDLVILHPECPGVGIGYCSDSQVQASPQGTCILHLRRVRACLPLSVYTGMAHLKLAQQTDGSFLLLFVLHLLG